MCATLQPITRWSFWRVQWHTPREEMAQPAGARASARPPHAVPHVVAICRHSAPRAAIMPEMPALPAQYMAGSKEADLWDLFCKFDEDASGEIDTVELEAMIESLGMNVKADDLDRWIKDADDSGDGKLQFDEFLGIMNKAATKQDSGLSLSAIIARSKNSKKMQCARAPARMRRARCWWCRCGWTVARRMLADRHAEPCDLARGLRCAVRTDKMGPGISVASVKGENDVAESSGGAWATVVLDEWLSTGGNDHASVLLEVRARHAVRHGRRFATLTLCRPAALSYSRTHGLPHQPGPTRAPTRPLHMRTLAGAASPLIGTPVLGRSRSWAGRCKLASSARISTPPTWDSPWIKIRLRSSGRLLRDRGAFAM